MKLQTLSFTIAALIAVCLTGCDKKDKDAISMQDVNKGIVIITGEDGVEYEVVDLGIGIYFAKCNLGANSPEQSGSLFAWGETESKDFFSWTNYTWNEKGEPLSSPIKYTNSSTSKLENADDAAKLIMGEDWSIPRAADFKKLFTKKNCTSKYCKLNGVGGFLFTSVIKGYEGNSIFFPLSGMMDHDRQKFAGQYGWFWANELYTNPETTKLETSSGSSMCIQHTDIDNHTIEARQRSLGIPIRPVYKGEI